MSPTDGAVLTTEDLALRWGLEPATLENWRSGKSKKGPSYFKLGKGRGAQVRYRLKDVQDYERENKVVTE